MAAAALAVAATALIVPTPTPAAAATWTPPEGLPAGFPTPPSNLNSTNFSFSPRIAQKGDIVTINGTGFINLLKVWSGYSTQGSLSGVGTCTQTSTSCQVRVGAPDGWQGWIVLGANPGGVEVGPYDALAVLPSGPVATVPGAPTNVSAVGGKGQATVSWNAPASDGGAAISAYLVSAFVGGVFKTVKSFPSTSTTAVFTGLDNGVAVTFRVSAQNSKGQGASSATSPPVIPPFTSLAAAVNRQALDLLGRAPTAAESTAGVARLLAGDDPGELVADHRRSSDATTHVDPTTRLYFAYLQRVPDRSGLQFWVGRKRNGTTLSKISDTFAQSGEFRRKYGSLTNRQFVTLIYTDVLGRTADAAGVNFWTGRLDRQVTTRGQVMVGFSESNEYKRKKAVDVDVAVTWISLLQATPTSAEFADAVDDLEGGLALEDFATGILRTTRYANRF